MEAFPFPLLVADIGGTNTRVGFVPGPNAAPIFVDRFATQEAASIEGAIADLAIEADASPRAALLAAAGPVSGTRMEITNATRVIDADILGRRLNLATVAIVNDFEAQAAAIPHLGPGDLLTLQPGQAHPRGARLAIGPGTGFGVGFVVSVGEDFAVVASEGGHAGFGPESDIEARIWPHLERVEGRITIESVVSGEGLARIDLALAKANGEAASKREPSAIVAAALDVGDARATGAVALFLDLLARAAGDLALIAKATGGVFICGGIAPRLAPLIVKERFRERFAARPPMSAMLGAMPVHLVTAAEPAFLGLAALGRPDARIRASEMAIWRA